MSGGEEEEEEFLAQMEEVYEHWVAQRAPEPHFYNELRPDKPESVHLRFSDQTYSMSDLVETLEGIEHLMLLEGLRDLSYDGLVPLQAGYYPDWLEDMRKQASGQVEVQRLSLNSPLDLVVYVGTFSGALVTTLLGWIELRDRFTTSQLHKARAVDEIDRLRLRKMALRYLEKQFGDLSPVDARKLPKGHPMKQLVEKASKSLLSLDAVSPDEDSQRKR